MSPIQSRKVKAVANMYGYVIIIKNRKKVVHRERDLEGCMLGYIVIGLLYAIFMAVPIWNRGAWNALGQVQAERKFYNKEETIQLHVGRRAHVGWIVRACLKEQNAVIISDTEKDSTIRIQFPDRDRLSMGEEIKKEIKISGLKKEIYMTFLNAAICETIVQVITLLYIKTGHGMIMCFEARQLMMWGMFLVWGVFILIEEIGVKKERVGIYDNH